MLETQPFAYAFLSAVFVNGNFEIQLSRLARKPPIPPYFLFSLLPPSLPLFPSFPLYSLYPSFHVYAPMAKQKLSRQLGDPAKVFFPPLPRSKLRSKLVDSLSDEHHRENQFFGTPWSDFFSRVSSYVASSLKITVFRDEGI